MSHRWFKPLLVGVFVLGMGAACATAQDVAAQLKALPSKPGPHTAKIAALGDNQWIDLGAPAADPQWGGARGRAWTPKMAYAADLGGAFFHGEGVHGYVKPDGHVMNDFWFYDANAHRWVCCYPGTKKEGMKLKLNADGFESDENGTPVPLAMLGHGYCNMTYIPDLKKYMAIHVNSQYWTSYAPQRKEWIQGWTSGEKHPWLFDVASGRFERVKVDGAGPRGKYQCVLEYIPQLKEVFYQWHGKVYYYNPAKRAWRDAGVKGEVKYDNNGCLDTKRSRVYHAKVNDFQYFDIAANKWVKVDAPGQPENLPACNFGCMFYDSANDAVVFHQRVGEIYAYHIEANKWEVPAKSFPAQAKVAGGVHGFYHPVQNVHYYYFARDSRSEGATMLAYRYKRAAK